MKKIKTKEIAIEFYFKFFKQILDSTIKERASNFYGRKLNDQKDIGKEIDRVSREMAKKLIGKLMKKGYPQKEIPDSEFQKIVKEVLKGFSDE